MKQFTNNVLCSMTCLLLTSVASAAPPRDVAPPAARKTAESSPVQIDTLSAEGGTVLKQLEDGSVVASGPNPATQTCQIDFTLGETPTEAIRLEALTHDSLANKSTGRGAPSRPMAGACMRLSRLDAAIHYSRSDPTDPLDENHSNSLNAFAAAGVFSTSFYLRGKIHEQSPINTP